MQCRRCGFENMPGMTTCMQCQSALTAAKVDVHPPRAGWSRHFRPIVYWYNRKRDGAKTVAPPPSTDPRAMLWVVISIVPGLGHLASGRLRSLWWLWPAWFLLFVLGLLGAGATWGSIIMGLAIGLHAWIALDAADLRALFGSVAGRVACVMIGFLLLNWLVYGGFAAHILGGSVMPDNIGSHGIHIYDHVVFLGLGSLNRGDLVRYSIHGTGPIRLGEYQVHGGLTVGRLLAFPGEKVLIGHGVLTVAEAGQARRYVYSPLNVLFPTSGGDNGDFEFVVPKGYFLCFPDSVRISNTLLAPHVLLQRLGLVREDEVQGRAIMIYNTFRHVARIPRLPLEVIKEKR